MLVDSMLNYAENEGIEYNNFSDNYIINNFTKIIQSIDNFNLLIEREKLEFLDKKKW